LVTSEKGTTENPVGKIKKNTLAQDAELRGQCNEANIRDGGKTVHVVFIYLCKRLLGIGYGADPWIFQ
jgi:hypothetical protein